MKIIIEYVVSGWLVLNVVLSGALFLLLMIHEIDPHFVDGPESRYCNNYNYARGDIIMPGRFVACTTHEHFKEEALSFFDWMSQPL